MSMIEKNKIYNLDCFEYLKMVDDNSIDLVFIDPPYFIANITKKMNKKTSIRGSSKNRVFQADWDDNFKSLDEYKAWNIRLFNELQRVMKDKAQAYIFCSYHHNDWLSLMIKNCGFRFYKMLIWYKPDVMGIFPNQYGCNYESILWFSKRGKTGSFKNHIGCAQRDVFIFHSTTQSYRKEAGFHPTPKPIELIRRLIKNSSDEGDLVLDCFMGSGTTAIAAKNTGRNFTGCEVSPEYMKIIDRRLSQENLNVWRFENDADRTD